MSKLILNGRQANSKPDEILVVNRPTRFMTPIVNGLMSTDVSINGLDRPPVLSGCALNLPLWHPICSPTSFKSLDTNDISCTVTGATWTPQGRIFVGTSSQYISLGSIDALNPTNLTFLAWAKPSAITGETGDFYGMCNAAVTIYRNFRMNEAKLRYSWQSVGGAYRGYETDGDVLSIDTWVFVAATQVGTAAPIIYVNGIATASSLILTSGAATLPATQAISIGRMGDGDLQYFSGIIGEVCLYNRAITAAEMYHIYLATKWRYS